MKETRYKETPHGKIGSNKSRGCDDRGDLEQGMSDHFQSLRRYVDDEWNFLD